VATGICKWERESGIFFDRVVVAVGTGSTYAGLLNGFRSMSRDVPVTGFTIARDVGTCLKAMARFTSLPVDIRDDSLLGGYGRTTGEQMRFLAEMLSRHAILFDPIYSGKALWGLHRLIAAGKCPDERVLFVHTGSLPLAIDGLEAIDG
jgi:D-cysteine desulfhydrase